jgi:hypothetical protein
VRLHIPAAIALTELPDIVQIEMVFEVIVIAKVIAVVVGERL